MSHFLFVESNTTGTGAIALQRLVADRHRVTFFTRAPAAYSFLPRHANRVDVVTVETNDAAAVARAAATLHDRRRIDSILTFSDFYVPVVAETAAGLELRYLNPETARTCREKPRTRQALRRAGLPTPETWIVASAADALRVAGMMPYPCVVKPPADSSSHGVRLVDGPDALMDHFHRLSARRTNTRGQAQTGEVVVESLLEGPEFSVETMTLAKGRTHVIGITAKHLSAPPYFVEIGHDFPAPLAGDRARELAAATLAALEAVGFDFGPAHTELRWTAAGPVVVEINPRLAGGMIPELVAQATGIDLLGACLDLAAGRPVDLEPCRDRVAAIRFLLAPAVGVLTGIDGVAAARRLATVRDVTVSSGIGTAVGPAEDAYGRLGFVIAAGDDRRRVARDLERAIELIRFTMEAAPAVA